MIVTCEIAVVTAGVHNVSVLLVHGNVTALSSPDTVPIGTPDAKTGRTTGNPDRAVILLCAIHVIRKLIVESDMVELSCCNIFLCPCQPTVVGDGCAAV